MTRREILAPGIRQTYGLGAGRRKGQCAASLYAVFFREAPRFLLLEDAFSPHSRNSSITPENFRAGTRIAEQVSREHHDSAA